MEQVVYFISSPKLGIETLRLEITPRTSLFERGEQVGLKYLKREPVHHLSQQTIGRRGDRSWLD